MEFNVGIACGRCDTFSSMGTSACPVCGHGLSLLAPSEPAAPVAGGQNSDAQGRVRKDIVQDAEAVPAGPHAVATEPSRENLMEQARNYVCRECSCAVPSGHRFCGSCGAAVPEEVVQLRTEYFGSMQTPGKARLVLIRSGSDASVDGASYMLQGEAHLCGRSEGQILFPNDPWLNPEHASFVYQGDTLLVRDEGSLNGVFLRLREPVMLQPGDHFLCGEQLLSLQPAPPEEAQEQDDKTYFYCSPRYPCTFAITQLVEGGGMGIVRCARDSVIEIGREGADLNFPQDVYMSGRHARVVLTEEGAFLLADLGSRNGTFVRVSKPQALEHGDYLFVGKQLLRVELTD